MCRVRDRGFGFRVLTGFLGCVCFKNMVAFGPIQFLFVLSCREKGSGLKAVCRLWLWDSEVDMAVSEKTWPQDYEGPYSEFNRIHVVENFPSGVHCTP